MTLDRDIGHPSGGPPDDEDVPPTDREPADWEIQAWIDAQEDEL